MCDIGLFDYRGRGYFIVAALASIAFTVIAALLPPNVEGELEPFTVVVAASVVLGIMWPWSLKTIAGCMGPSTLDFESLYAKYPRKEGKKRGMEILRRTVKTEAEYQAFAGALDNYLALCKKEKREGKYLLHWKTFVNNWTDYLQEIEADKPAAISQMERIIRGEL